ncbi:MAG TPA: hypothetical protein DCE42_09880 [Myxococcales bacterium]|nr:hypothetical protein [Deltaproteobacteria bacterium]MBU50687.1 hypothetical protein [Deltaproteobacteria bacterium]HAA55057.1 hypothetical protein [Myxococcales bacterium]
MIAIGGGMKSNLDKTPEKASPALNDIANIAIPAMNILRRGVWLYKKTHNIATMNAIPPIPIADVASHTGGAITTCFGTMTYSFSPLCVCALPQSQDVLCVCVLTVSI